MVTWYELKWIRRRQEMKTAPGLLEWPMTEAWDSKPAWQQWEWEEGREGRGIAKWEPRELLIGVRCGLRTRFVIKKKPIELLSQSVTPSAKIFQHQPCAPAPRRVPRTDSSTNRTRGMGASVTGTDPSEVLLCKHRLGQGLSSVTTGSNSSIQLACPVCGFSFVH